MYPIIDKQYEDSWKAANESDDAEWNKYYFCQNYTIAKEIEQTLIKDTEDFLTKAQAHREALAALKTKSFAIDNTNSSKFSNITLNVSQENDYDAFLKNMTTKYENTYEKTIEKIRDNLKSGDETYKRLKNNCLNYQETPKAEKPIPVGPNKVDGSDTGSEEIFIELKSGVNMLSKKEKALYMNMMQLIERIRKITGN